MHGGFFSRRWNGAVAVPILLWRDMLTVGTLINVVSTAVGLALLAQDMHGGYAVMLHLLPLPYNAFLLLALKRQRCDTVSELIAYGWFVAMLVL